MKYSAKDNNGSEGKRGAMSAVARAVANLRQWREALYQPVATGLKRDRLDVTKRLAEPDENHNLHAPYWSFTSWSSNQTLLGERATQLAIIVLRCPASLERREGAEATSPTETVFGPGGWGGSLRVSLPSLTVR
jgi:hypothetical protein